MPLDPQRLLQGVVALAERAGEAILRVYAEDFEVRRKADASPVTEADEAAEHIILPGLAALAPEIPIVAEEQTEAHGLVAVDDGPFWLVDPLDGTKEFIARNGEFTVNIALVEDGAPVLGVVHAPALGHTYAAAGPGSATFAEGGGSARPVAARRTPPKGAVVMASRSHGNSERLERFLKPVKVQSLTSIGSSLKFCLIARGEADLYPRFGPTMEWDTAAGDAVLRAAGGSVRTLDGALLAYRKPGHRNPEFIARGRDG